MGSWASPVVLSAAVFCACRRPPCCVSTQFCCAAVHRLLQPCMPNVSHFEPLRVAILIENGFGWKHTADICSRRAADPVSGKPDPPQPILYSRYCHAACPFAETAYFAASDTYSGCMQQVRVDGVLLAHSRVHYGAQTVLSY